jgi:hypothetical protein
VLDSKLDVNREQKIEYIRVIYVVSLDQMLADWMSTSRMIFEVVVIWITGDSVYTMKWS